ncbi:tRNA (N(6)-L-threonylcarbamoyladenosine(37)-C(2))-methylthiotransferase MtaB [Parvularcula lutaonensis]|uniref:tRNA (N(6)-L-threonylcarbamoyladenosine(37)-C(2))-methylthiotransferase n=1 Tax=Parvularcula lutaonensis TaxID=491923 RepID=A0ABV7MBU6_9PROT|nr:tRNA (N(6)-L-threonylcarbamoyladenosine(37)-C(2))-methylthiotransferase MtaB [Parvularcula lutaonensis]
MSENRAITVNLGCRLNASETEAMANLAEEGGTAPVIVNTCAVTREAVRQSRQAIRRAAKQNPGRPVVVTGCAAELEPEAFEAMPEVARRIPNGRKLDPAAWKLPETAPVRPRSIDVRAPLAVQNGCDHRCTFCIIPYGRGDARSLPVAEACDRAMELVERGAKEIVLTGVDLTSWGPDLGEGLSLGHLVEALNDRLPDDIWIRLSSIDGAEIDDRLFRLMTGVERIAPYAHLSLQAGHDMILKRMKRRHSRQDAIDLCHRLRDARPGIAFGADLIAGFPTETEEMFKASLDLVAECDLAYVHVFPFSPRAGTPAARMPQLPRDVVKDRAARLRAAAGEALARHLDARTGRTAEVLIEEIKHGAPRGRLADFTDVHFATGTPLSPGDRVVARLGKQDGRHLVASAG